VPGSLACDLTLKIYPPLSSLAQELIQNRLYNKISDSGFVGGRTKWKSMGVLGKERVPKGSDSWKEA
jgi:hypothetical protein